MISVYSKETLTKLSLFTIAQFIEKRSIGYFEIAAELENSEITPYDEVTGEGDLRYLAVRASHLTEELMLTFVMTNEKHKIALRIWL